MSGRHSRRDPHEDPQVGDKFRHGPHYIVVAERRQSPVMGAPEVRLRIINPGVGEDSRWQPAPLPEWMAPGEWAFSEIAEAALKTENRRVRIEAHLRERPPR